LRRACAGLCWDTSDARTSTPNTAVTYTGVSVISEGPSWTYTTVLIIVVLVVAAILVVRFLRTGGPAMLRMMNTPEEEMAQQDQAIAGMDYHGLRHDTRMEGMGHAGPLSHQAMLARTGSRSN
jgi:hypothetical protein